MIEGSARALRFVNARSVTTDGITDGDIVIRGGTITDLGDPVSAPADAQVIDLNGAHVLPGFIDVHTHLREPGQRHKEDFESGTYAAAASGITVVVAQPNTSPPIFGVEDFIRVVEIAGRRCHVDFAVAPALVGGRHQDLEALVASGAVYFDMAMGGSSPTMQTTDPTLLRAALDAAAQAGLPTAVFANAGDLHARYRAGLQEQARTDPRALFDAYPPEVELVALQRLLELAAGREWRLHLKQISCGASVPVIEQLKQCADVSAEVTPHHLFLDASALDEFGAFAAMGPPLRTPEDNRELLDAVARGVIDHVATDHAPHHIDEKRAAGSDIWAAPLGIPVLETFLPVLLRAVVEGQLTLGQVARAAATGPARRFGLATKGELAPGKDADLVVVDLEATFVFDPQRTYTKAKYSPFAGRAMTGPVGMTMVRGRPVWVSQAFAKSSGLGVPRRDECVGWGRFLQPLR